MNEPGAQSAKALERIAVCTDAGDLRRIATNARRCGNDRVHDAALRRLYAVLPSAEPGTLEYDVWQSIHALEGELSRERGKTVRLGRTRPKIARDGEVKTVADLVRGAPSDGFQMLAERNMLDLSFEAVALRHAERFDGDVLEAAARRLREHGFEMLR